jgi:hypothetical protein
MIDDDAFHPLRDAEPMAPPLDPATARRRERAPRLASIQAAGEALLGDGPYAAWQERRELVKVSG